MLADILHPSPENAVKRPAIHMILSCLVSSFLFLGFAVDSFAAAEADVRLPERFEARALWEAFKKDQTAMESRLVGSTVVVTGVVTDTGMSRYMTPCVYLAEGENTATLVICVLPRADTLKLSHYTKGQRVSMKGRVYGFGAHGVVIKESATYEAPALQTSGKP